MDFCDIASDLEQLERDVALAALRSPPAGESAKWCEGEACGVRIPDKRRRAVPGVRLCVDCQTITERK
jgi:phage/conjugal plasmid C-4 type zinc finger TraR family protein